MRQICIKPLLWDHFCLEKICMAVKRILGHLGLNSHQIALNYQTFEVTKSICEFKSFLQTLCHLWRTVSRIKANQREKTLLWSLKEILYKANMSRLYAWLNFSCRKLITHQNRPIQLNPRLLLEYWVDFR